MKQVYGSVLDLIGNTPIVRLNRVVHGVQAEIYVKLEFLNPGGSVKDRIALHMVNGAEERGELKPGGTIVEATSGNTGAGLALVAAIRGYQSVFVMPDKMSEEKIRALRALGSQVVVTPTAVDPEDPRSYYKVSRKIAAETANSFYSNQYYNPDNPGTHYQATGPEIWDQMGEDLDVLVCGMGTGGTISGTGHYLKEKKPGMKVVGVDPVGSVYYDYWVTGKLTDAYTYKVEGIGEDFLPGTMDMSVVDEVIRVGDKESFLMTRDLVRKEGILCGGSSGAAVAGAIKYAQAHPDEKLKILVILPDSYVRYLSKIFDEGWMRGNRYLDPEVQLGKVGDVVENRRRKVISARLGEAVTTVVERMKNNGVSQLPVLGPDGQIAGFITEVAMLRHVVEQGGRGDAPIDPLLDLAYCVVDPQTTVSVLSELFTRVKVAVVMQDREITNIVTRIDLIDYMSKISSQQ